jgi:hypothetical protein
MAEPEFAEDFLLDGFDEALTMFAPRQLRLKRMTNPGKAVTFRLPGLWGRARLSDTAVLAGDVELASRVIRGPLTP